MIGKIIIASSFLFAGFTAAVADHHEAGPPPEEGPHVVLAPPPDFMPPEDFVPPEDPAEAEAALLDLFIASMDADGDGAISPDEFKAWVMHAHLPPPPEGDGEGPPPEGEMSGVSEGDEGLEGLPHPPACNDDVRDSELTPQAEGEACSGSESVGNLLFRTVCNTAPYNTNAISLPEGRAADCFDIEAIAGHNIAFEIVRESDGAVMFDTSMGKDAFHTLVLTGDPGGTVYQIKLMSADEPDARLTIRFIDHPMF